MIERIVADLGGTLEREKAYFMFGGDLAVRVWGLAAPTYGVELTVAIRRDALARLLKRLEDEGYIVPQAATTGWVDEGDGVPGVRIARENDGRLWDIAMHLADSSFLKSAVERRRKVKVGREEVWMMSPEDVILNKLQAGTNMDLLQAVEIMAVTHPLDFDHLTTWAKELDVEFQLSEVKTRAQLFE